MHEDNKLPDPMTDKLENMEALEEAGFTPRQSTALAKILENVAQKVAKVIVPYIDAKFEQFERIAEIRHESLKSSISMLTWVLGFFAALVTLFMAVISYALLR